MKSLKIRTFFTHALVVVFASSFLMSCGPKRVRPVVSLKNLKFANNASVEQAALNNQSEAQIQNLLGSYQGTWTTLSGSGPYQMDLSTEEVEIEETEQEYTFAKMTLNSGSIQLVSYLAIQAGTVSNTPAFALSSTVLSHAAVTPQAFGIYLILAHQAGQFHQANSAAYMLDCSTATNGACTSNTALSSARFTSGLNKIQ
jgi:hypothetical protein